VSETRVPTAKHLIEQIAQGDRTQEEILEACRLWLKLHDRSRQVAEDLRRINLWTGTASQKEGILRMQRNRRWSICRPDRIPVELASGYLFHIEADGDLKLTRLEYDYDKRAY